VEGKLYRYFPTGVYRILLKKLYQGAWRNSRELAKPIIPKNRK
jgi:hypothetical protein